MCTDERPEASTVEAALEAAPEATPVPAAASSDAEAQPQEHAADTGEVAGEAAEEIAVPQEAEPDAQPGEDTNEPPSNWGNIKDVLNAPLGDTPADASWFAVFFMWIWLIPSLVQGIIGGLVPRVFVCFAIGTCCIPGSQLYCSIIGSVLRGRPLYMAWTFWRGVFATLVALLANGGRLGLFIWEWKAFGGAEYWWHGEGVWMGSYEKCNQVLQAVQHRKPAFGAVKACTPDLYPSKLLIFLPNLGPDCEWAAIRKALHQFFLYQGISYMTRLERLPELLREDVPDASVKTLKDLRKLDRLVAKSIFYMMFEVWITDKEAKTLANWRKYAEYFILPRIFHRFMFNVGVRAVKKLREDTVALVEKYEKQNIFVRMNESLGDNFKRNTVVELVDEIMFAIGFAGIGGTCAATESAAGFLRCKFPKESPGKHYIHWGQYDTSEKMVEKYTQNPERYIREVVRMDPPVTSATTSLSEETQVTLAGKEFTLPQGLLNQYALSIANRDPVLFPEDKVFNPDRENLEKALTWNGAFGADNEESYPRICPGRYMSLDITKAIINHLLGIGRTMEVTV